MTVRQTDKETNKQADTQANRQKKTHKNREKGGKDSIQGKKNSFQKFGKNVLYFMKFPVRIHTFEVESHKLIKEKI